MNFFLEEKVIKKVKDDLLHFSDVIKELTKLLEYLNLIAVTGGAGTGKTSFLNLIKDIIKDKKVLVIDSSYFFKKTNKKLDGDLIVIDNFHNLAFLTPNELIEVLKRLENKKVILSINNELFKNITNDNKVIINNYLNKTSYNINLEKFYEKSNLKTIIDKFKELLKNEFNIEMSEEEEEILYFIFKRRLKTIRQIKKILLMLYLNIKFSKEKITNIKDIIPKDYIITYYWDKEMGKAEKVDVESVFKKSDIEKNKDQEKKEDIMDINTLISKYNSNELHVEKKEDLLTKVKNNPNIIEENIILQEFNENVWYKGHSVKEFISKKPQLMGYKDNNFYLIYVIENIKDLEVKELDEMSKVIEKGIKEKVNYVLITKDTESNKKIIKDLGLYKLFKIIFI